MEINITKEQYGELVSMLAIANSVVGVLGDVLPESGYQARLAAMNDLENYFLQYASDFEFGEAVQEIEPGGILILSEDFYKKNVLPAISDYEGFVAQETLASELAWRDLAKEHSQEELDKMDEEDGSRLEEKLSAKEEKYWQEFNEHGFERLEIIE